MTLGKIERLVPAILTRDNADIEVGTAVTVTRSYWRNGEGWVRTKEFGDIPDIFVDFDYDAV